MITSQQVLEFWFETLSHEQKFAANDEVDAKIRTQFLDAWYSAAGGGLADWETSAESALALVILLDQFPRNMFRGSGQSFHSDALAREVANRAIERGFDMQFEEMKRIFFYLPFMHSERIEDQDRCVALIGERMQESGQVSLLHARAHREVVRKFGRFPFRNEALEREYAEEEKEMMDFSVYLKIVDELKEREETK